MSDQTNTTTNDANQGQADGLVTQLPVAPRRVLPKRIVKLPLPEPYNDFSVTAWLNHPPSVRAGMRSLVEAEARAAFKEVLVAHDLVDFDGEPYPQAGDEFYDAISEDLLRVIYLEIIGNVGKLVPTSGGR